MKCKTVYILFVLTILVNMVLAFELIPGGPKTEFKPETNVSSLSQPGRIKNNFTPFLVNYNSYFYTFGQAHIFSYYNSTNFTGFWNGTLNQDKYQYLTTSAGVYNITGSQPYSLLAGQPIVAGFFAKDEEGKGVSTKLLTYMPAMYYGGEKFVIFSYTSGTSVVVTNLSSPYEILLSTTLNDGQRVELTTTAYSKWLKVEASNPVSVLSYADQEYNVPARTGLFVGTDFYTWVGYIGNWHNDLNIVAWSDSTPYLVTDTLGTPIASGLLNRTEIACIQTIVNKYVRVTSGKKVSVSVAPYLSWSGLGYARFSTMRDSTGFGAGNYFVFPINGAGVNVHILSFRNNNTITIKDLDFNTVLWSGTLNAGQTQSTSVYGQARRIEVSSSDLAGVDVYYSGYGADFAPLEFSAPGHDVGVTEILAPIGLLTAGTSITPRAVVHNYSSYSENFTVVFSFTGYSDTQNVNGLAAGATDTVEFNSWTAMPGFYNTVAYSRLAGDQTPANDTAYGRFEVTSQTITDVGVTAILAPIGTITAGAVVTPISVVENFSTSPEEDFESFWIFFKFGTYRDSNFVTLEAGEVDTIEFTEWTAAGGFYNVMSYSMLEQDENRYNDTAYSSFEVISSGYRDVGVAAVIQPSDTIITCSPFIPVIDIVNNSSPQQVEVCTVDVNIWYYRVKMDSLCHISCNPLDSMLAWTGSVEASVIPGHNNVSMDTSWHPVWSDVYWVGGHHVIRASVRMNGDMNPDNDFMNKNFIVEARDHDLQMNYVGLLKSNTVVQGDTIGADFTYNTVSIVSNSSFGPTAVFRAYYRIIRNNDNAVVYSKYLDRTLNPQTYTCLYFQSGWVPEQEGWYLVKSWIQARPGIDMVSENNLKERLFYARLGGANILSNNRTTIPLIFSLLQNQPNPFKGRTNISWQIPIKSRVKITIYDATGRNIKTLVNETRTAGYYNTTWDCTDEQGKKVATGVYFYEMKSNDYTSRRKMVITH